MSKTLPVELKPERITAIIDTREQLPLELAPLQVERGTLKTGDYSVKGLEHIIAIERKSATDMLACIGRERERFDAEIQRMLAYDVRAIVIEAGWGYFERGDWQSKITPAQAMASLLGWITYGIPIVMCYDHARAGVFVSRILFTAARRRWREARELIKHAVAEEVA